MTIYKGFDIGERDVRFFEIDTKDWTAIKKNCMKNRTTIPANLSLSNFLQIIFSAAATGQQSFSFP